MSNTILTQLKALYDQELYSSVVKMCDLALTVCEQKPDTFTLTGKHQATLYYADALYQLKQYVQAEVLYQQALRMRKLIMNKSKHTNNKIIENQAELVSDVEIKYKIHMCCMALKQKIPAVDILQTINARQRTPKINMALGNVYMYGGMERSAITCFKEVLKECPWSIEAMENLLQLGVNGIEVNSLVLGASSEVTWLSQWIKAQAQLHSRDYANALQTYKSMDTHGLLKDNIYLLVNMAYCYHYMCEDNKAINVLQRAIRIDPNLTCGRDLLATLLVASGNKDHQTALENLTPNNLDNSLWTAEHWVALGNVMLFLKKYDKAAYFGQQACAMSSRNVEAYLLKANALFQLSKYQEAAIHCTDALQICSIRYDLHKCLVDCYLQSNRLREAEAMAINACKELNYSAHSYCLHASCLLKDPMASTKNIRRLLERASAQDKNGHTNAIYMLADLLIREKQYEEVTQLISRTLETQKPTSRLHQVLGDCYVHLLKDDEAFNHYTIALRLDPQNQRATEGFNYLGRIASTSKRDQFYSCGDETHGSRRTNSDHEGDAESDNEMWPSTIDTPNFE